MKNHIPSEVTLDLFSGIRQNNLHQNELTSFFKKVIHMNLILLYNKNDVLTLFKINKNIYFFIEA